MPAHVVGEEAEEEVRPHPVLAVVEDRAHGELDALQAPEGALDCGQALVGLDDGGRAQELGRHGRAHDVESVERGLFRDLVRAPAIGEDPVGDSELEVLGHLLRVHHPPCPQADRGGRAQATAADHAGDLRERLLGGRKERLALAGALLGERRVATHDEPLAGKLRTRDLDEVALVEERELEIAGRDEGADGGGPQAAHPADPAELLEALDARARQHPAVADEDELAEPEALAELLDLRLHGRRSGDVAGKGLDGERAAPRIAHEAELDLRAVAALVAAVAVGGERAAAALEVGAREVVEHEAASAEMPSRQ